MTIKHRQAVKEDAELLVIYIMLHFMMIMSFMGSALLMDRQKNIWNNLLRILRNTSF